MFSSKTHTVEFPRHNLSINQIKYLRKVSSKRIGFGCLTETAKPASDLGLALFASVLNRKKCRKNNKKEDREEKNCIFLSAVNRPETNLKNHLIKFTKCF